MVDNRESGRYCFRRVGFGFVSVLIDSWGVARVNHAMTCPAEILAAANAGRPLRPEELTRLANAAIHRRFQRAGIEELFEPISSRAMRMRLEKIDEKFRRLLVESVGVAVIEEVAEL